MRKKLTQEKASVTFYKKMFDDVRTSQEQEVVETMASKEFRRSNHPAVQTITINGRTTDESSDPLFDRDWEVFVVKRDEVSGELTTRTARYEDDLGEPRPLVTNRLSFC